MNGPLLHAYAQGGCVVPVGSDLFFTDNCQRFFFFFFFVFFFFFDLLFRQRGVLIRLEKS